jgi:hypothetical protein
MMISMMTADIKPCASFSCGLFSDAGRYFPKKENLFFSYGSSLWPDRVYPVAPIAEARAS